MRAVMHNISSILHNFYLICQWHRHPFEEASFDLDNLHKLNVMDNEEEEIGKETDKVEDCSFLYYRISMTLLWRTRKVCQV